VVLNRKIYQKDTDHQWGKALSFGHCIGGGDKKIFIIAPKIHESKISVFAVLNDNLKLVSTYENSNETTIIQVKYFGVVMPSGLGQSKLGSDSWNSLLVFLVKKGSQAHVKIMRFGANGDDYNTAYYQLETLLESSEFSGMDFDEMFVDEDRKLIFLFKNNSSVLETLEYKDGKLTRQLVDSKTPVQNIVAFTKWTEKLYCVLSVDSSKSLTALVFSMDGRSDVSKPTDLGANPVIIPLGRYDYPFLLINSATNKMILLGKKSADKDLKIEFNELKTLKLPKGLDLNTITPFEHGAILYGEGTVEKMKMFEIVLDL